MSAPFDDNRYEATVIRHVDGDTTHIAVSPGFDLTLNLTIRWYGVDAPEISTPDGKAALAWVEGAMPVGSVVTFQSFKGRKEKYGRYLGTFYTADGRSLNDGLIAAGHAVPYFGGTK